MIESIQNERIKYLIRLGSDNRFRKKSGVFVVEGKQENERARQFGYLPQELFICEAIYQDNIPKGKVTLVSEKVYEKIAYRGSSEGIIGIYEVKESKLEDFIPNPSSAVILVEGIEKPGNLGAILRSCEAFGIDALIVTESKTDFYNPNVIRSSVGCLFGMNLFSVGNSEAQQYLEKHDFKIYSTYMDEEAIQIDKVELTERIAIIFGTEHSGLGNFWLDNSKNILIPMSGTIDSLNLSNAVAIGCYEINRQKKA